MLLQSGKGGDVASAFGGAGSQTAFGPRGAQKPLEKATIASAVIFMLLALIFSLPGVTGGSSVVKEPVETATPAPAAPAPAATTLPSASPAAASPAASVSVAPSAAASVSSSAAASPAASASPAKK